MDPKAEIHGLRDRCNDLERTVGELEDQRAALTERIAVLDARIDILSKQVYTTDARQDEFNARVEALVSSRENQGRGMGEYR